jgi:hypothetical protein
VVVRDNQGNLLATIVCLEAEEGIASLLITHPVEPPLITVVLEDPSEQHSSKEQLEILLETLNQMIRDQADLMAYIDWDGAIQIRKGM